MNPWNLRSAMLARHAQHVVLIHFPIALFLTGLLFDVAATWTRRKDLATVAFWNLSVAAFSAFPAALSGLLAWQWELDGRRLKGLLLLHLLFGSTSLLAILLVWWLHLRARRTPQASLSGLRWPLEAVSAIVVALTGHLGGFLSGVNHP